MKNIKTPTWVKYLQCIQVGFHDNQIVAYNRNVHAIIMVVACNSPGWGLHLMWGIVKNCPRGGFFALSIVQIPTYAREG